MRSGASGNGASAILSLHRHGAERARSDEPAWDVGDSCHRRDGRTNLRIVTESQAQEIETLYPQSMWRERAAVDRLRERERRGLRVTAEAWDRQLERLRASHALWLARREAIPRWTFPPELPISDRAEEIIEALRHHPVLIVAGETGSGKTTQLPKMALAAGFGIGGKIACTQPRRVAALSVSRRIAEELQVPWGREVGAKIRFTDRSGVETLIKTMTDGMLLAEVQGDPELWEYDVIIVDEAHERSLNIDFLLGYLQRLRVRRPQLRMIITSATIDTEAFSAAFAGAPIIAVSGRTYPVEIRYGPIDEMAEERGDFTYLEAAAEAVGQVVAENRPGDILVFLPGEKDIRELRAMLDGERLGRVEILPLFGRLSNAEQARIFAPTQARKIVLATNIAETSITIPGIRYVIDTGLARISRYHSGTHTRRLPIEPVAQSSADQRAGRAGRVEAGVCIRLYSEQDYSSRPRYATPELLRANLAEVILRMVAFKLGEIESFPFLNPPSPGAVNAGYQLLQDLGALDGKRQLTPLGRELARLPCDPTVGRMLLQARDEGAVREVLVIAAGLSIQDPRERPADAQEAADRMHAGFVHPESDFLTLLNIWEAYHEKLESLTQNQLRRFCRDHFLSYLRMREWRDVHAQLSQVMRDLSPGPKGILAAEYDQIHRSIVVGLLSNIAHREAGNHYLGTHHRNVMLHPGSGLFDKSSARHERKKFKGKQKPAPVSGKRTPPWVVCAEWMETSRLFARTVARIDAGWIESLGAHVLKTSYVDPGYDEKGERAVVREKKFLYGLEVSAKRVGYGRIDPEAARLLFVREGLVAGTLQTRLPWYAHNQEVRAEVENQQTRLRQASLWQLDERIEAFYLDRLPQVGSVAELQKWWRGASPEEQSRLYVSVENLLPTAPADTEAFPESVEIEGVRLPLEYHYRPGDESDGATLRVPFGAFSKLDPVALDWAVPGYTSERIEHMLKGLPKETRRRLHPLGEKGRELAELVTPRKGTLRDQLTRLIGERFGVRIWPEEWDGRSVPSHLLPRIEVVDSRDVVVAKGREWSELEAAVRLTESGGGEVDEDHRRARERLWTQARARFERPSLQNWSFPDMPERLEIGAVAGVPVTAYPGLEVSGGDEIHLRLFRSKTAAHAATKKGFPRLVGEILAKDLAWFEREVVRELRRVKLASIGFIPWPAFERQAGAHARNYALDLPAPRSLVRAVFEDACAIVRGRLPGWAPRFVDQLETVILRRGRLLKVDDPHGIARATLERLLPVDFLEQLPSGRLEDLPRYLDAAECRIEKARRDPARDRERARVITLFERRLDELRRATPERQNLRWAVEEFRISTFAQHLGTHQKISLRVLEELWRAAQRCENPEPEGDVIPRKTPATTEIKSPATAKSRPVAKRDLDALKRLWEQ